MVSREYKIFLREEFEQTVPHSLFEKLALAAGKVIKPKLKAETEKKLEESIAFTGMALHPSDVIALSVLAPLIMLVLVILVGLAGVISFNFTILAMVLVAGIGVYIYYYPSLMERQAKIRAASDIVLMTLYVAVSMRHVPNLEHAVKFAAENMRGPLAHQLRKLLWDIEVRKYLNIDQALEDYVEKFWQESNTELKEAFYLIRSSRDVTPRRRDQMLDESVSLVLEGSKERAKHYSQELRMPVTIINTMGILLPIIGLILLPIVTIFLQESVSPVSIILLYNIALPLFLFFMINFVLQKRPYTFSVPDVSAYPGMAKHGFFYMGSVPLPSIIPALIIGVAVAALGVLFIEGTEPLSGLRLGASLLLTIGTAVGFGIYFVLNSFQKLKLRDKIAQTEAEFAEALFEMGSKLSEGHPLEVSLEHAVKSIQGSPIAEFFDIALRNVKHFGMTLEAAIFDKKYGAINYYPSELIRSIMRIVVKTADRGVQATSITMMVLSKYLKGVHDVEEEMKDMLSETTSSLEFQAWGLAPVTAGIVVALGAAMTQIINKLEAILGSLEEITRASTGIAQQTSLTIFGPVSQLISPEAFQYIVGVYTIEIILLISFFYIMLTRGDERISQESHAGKMIVIGIVVYAISVVMLYSLFSALLPDFLIPSTTGGAVG